MLDELKHVMCSEQRLAQSQRSTNVTDLGHRYPKGGHTYHLGGGMCVEVGLSCYHANNRDTRMLSI